MDRSRMYPTHFEVLAIERAARRAQAAEMMRLLKLGSSRLKALIASVASAKAAGATAAMPGSSAPSSRAYGATDIEAFAASLPQDIRTRYASDLEAAARIEPLVNAGLAAADFTARMLAHAFHAVAGALHAAARSFDVIARRLTPTH